MLADVPGSILVATDTTPWSDGAIRLGDRLAHAGATVRLVTVLEGLPESGDVPDDAERETRERLSAQLVRTLGAADGIFCEVERGAAAPAIVAAARRTVADLIVLGRTDHGVAERTATQVVRRVNVPVLSAADTLSGRPRRIVVGMDFSRSSMRAARLALSIAAPDAQIYVVHVQPHQTPLLDEQEGWSVIYTQGIAGAFGRLVRELSAPEGVRLESVVVEGSPVTELLAFARKVRADLIVAGAHHASLDRRFAMGSAAAALLREAPCSVLLTPAVPSPRAA